MIGFAAEGDRAVVQIFPLRGGKMVDRHSFHVENVGGRDWEATIGGNWLNKIGVLLVVVGLVLSVVYLASIRPRVRAATNVAVGVPAAVA